MSGGRTKTHNNDKYVRKWWEVENYKRWQPYANGGEFRKWYGNNFDVVDWSQEATELYASKGGLYNKKFVGKSGICWNLITSAKNGFRIKESEFHYSSGSPTIFSDQKSSDSMYLGFLNSIVSYYLLQVINPTINTTVNSVLCLPFDSGKYEYRISEIVNDCLDSSKIDWDSFEISWNFLENPLLANKHSNKLSECFKVWEKTTGDRFSLLKKLEEELNSIFIEIYDLQDELTPEVEDKDVTVRKADVERDVRSFLSYLVGVIFGRYRLDKPGLAFAGGEFNLDEFGSYKPDKDNIIPITAEHYFEDDIVSKITELVAIIYGNDTLNENLQFIATHLGMKDSETPEDTIRRYFMKDFYKDHLKTYQKRPIYWLYDSGKQDGFKALVYMHRYTADTTGIVRVDYLHKMQKIYTSEIDRMIDMAENSNNTREIAQAEKRKEKLVKQLKETKEYDEKIAHLAISRIAIDLDDGVKVNYEKVQTGQDGNKLSILAKI